MSCKKSVRPFIYSHITYLFVKLCNERFVLILQVGSMTSHINMIFLFTYVACCTWWEYYFYLFNLILERSNHKKSLLKRNKYRTNFRLFIEFISFHVSTVRQYKAETNHIELYLSEKQMCSKMLINY